jgi:LDH2 family malate/lactate/ureidoglycolate dehydrogenase
VSALRVDGRSLRRFYSDALRASGVRSDHAEIVADGVYYADLHGLDSHGSQVFLRLYLGMVEAKTVDVLTEPVVAVSDHACAVVDGRNTLGFVVGMFAMEQAVLRARQYGVGAVAVRNSSHAGAMGFYCAAARRAGMLGMAFTNLGIQGMLAPPGGAKPIVGTNVLAASAPSGAEAPFNLDMSTAVVSAGRVRLAERQGRSIPAGWLADADGGDVTDPSALDRGTARLRFLGGRAETGAHKGFGLALLADVLSGLLSGAAVGPTPGKLTDERPQTGRVDAGIGHFFLALRIGAFCEEEQFRTRMDETLATIRLCPPVPGVEQVSYPGLPESSAGEQRASSGVPMGEVLFGALEAAAARLGVDPPAMLR